MLKFNPHIAYLVLIAALATIILFLLRGCGGAADPGGDHQPDSLIYWKNKAGDAVASLKGKEAAFSVKERGLLDSLAKVYAAKPKQVTEYVIIYQEGKTELDPVDTSKAADYGPVTDPDCPPPIKNLRQRFTSPYYTADVQIGDSSYLTLHSKDTVTVLWERKKEGPIFKRNQYLQINVSTANPGTRVSGLKAYRIADPKPKKWAIGLTAGYGISPMQKPQRPEPYIGIGLIRTLIRF